MKYYEGMTLQEVADAQGLPHETVKKRHQRSLSKLKALLITGLVLLAALALSACAYVVLRCFGLLPGYGVSTESDGPVYLLAEESSVECEYWTSTVEEAVLLDRALRINVIARFPEGGSAWKQWREMCSQYEGIYFKNLSLSDTSVSAAWIRESWNDVPNGPNEHSIKIGILPDDTASLLDGDETTLTRFRFWLLNWSRRGFPWSGYTPEKWLYHPLDSVQPWGLVCYQPYSAHNFGLVR